MFFTRQPRRAYTQPGPGQPTEIVDVASLPPVPPPFVYPRSLPAIADYDIVRLLDQGGMSNIYLAQQKGLNRPVVIKMIRPQDSLDQHIRSRFILEASSIASLQHPNVVQIYEIGESEGMPFLCLEYVAGGNLERKIRERLPSARESAEIVCQLAEAIEAAHERQIVHRDLKPANILCVAPAPGVNESATDSRITVKITDFGLARILCEASDQTKSGYAIGTPSFMSPEQASGRPEEIGKATDIYGLGAILYELLTGLPPFHGPTALDTIQMVRNQAPTPPSQINRVVPRDLERICLQCLEKQPENRYASAQALADDLSRFLQGRSVAAHPIGPIERLSRRWRRHRLRALAFSSIPVLVIGTIVAVALLNRADSDLKKKQLELEAARESIIASDPTALPAEVQDLLFKLRQNPTRSETARPLANLGDEWLTRLPRDFPQDFAVQYGVGNAYYLLERPDDAIASFERARRLAQQQTQQAPDNVENWAYLADVHERLGDVRLLQKDRSAALHDYEKAMNFRETLNQDDPRERRWALALASICRKQAELYAVDTQYSTALLFYDRQLSLLRGLLPDLPGLSTEIREVHARMAELHQRLGNKEAAASHIRDAKQISK